MHAVNNMILMIKIIDTEKVLLVPTGRREFKPVEINTSTFRASKVIINNYQKKKAIFHICNIFHKNKILYPVIRIKSFL